MLIHMLPLFVFTLCSGAAAGIIVIDFFDSFGDNSKVVSRWYDYLPVISLVLLGIGLLGTLTHLGQPLRFINGLSNPQSMISQEGYWSIAFGIVLLIESALVFLKKTRPWLLHACASFIACGLMIVTGLAYFQSLGYAAWSNAATIALFVLTDLLLGVVAVSLIRKFEVSRVHMGFGLAFGVIGAVVLSAYLLSVSISSTLLSLGIVSVLLLVVASIGFGLYLKFGVNQKAIMYSQVICAVCLLVGIVIERGVFFSAGAL